MHFCFVFSVLYVYRLIKTIPQKPDLIIKHTILTLHNPNFSSGYKSRLYKRVSKCAEIITAIFSFLMGAADFLQQSKNVLKLVSGKCLSCVQTPAQQGVGNKIACLLQARHVKQNFRKLFLKKNWSLKLSSGRLVNQNSERMHMEMCLFTHNFETPTCLHKLHLQENVQIINQLMTISELSPPPQT